MVEKRLYNKAWIFVAGRENPIIGFISHGLVDHVLKTGKFPPGVNFSIGVSEGVGRNLPQPLPVEDIWVDITPEAGENER